MQLQLVDHKHKKICPDCGRFEAARYCSHCGAELKIPEGQIGELMAMHMRARGFEDFATSRYAARFAALGRGFEVGLVRTDGFDRERVVDAVFIGDAPRSLKHPMHNPAKVAESIADFLRTRDAHYNHIQIYYLVPATRKDPAGHTTDSRRFNRWRSVRVTVVRYDPWRPDRFPRSSIKPIFQQASRQLAGRATTFLERRPSGAGSLLAPVVGPLRSYIAVLGTAISPVRLAREVRREVIRLPDVIAVGITSALLSSEFTKSMAWVGLAEGPAMAGPAVPFGLDQILEVLLTAAIAFAILAPLHLALKRMSRRDDPPRFRRAYIVYLMSVFIMLPITVLLTSLFGTLPQQSGLFAGEAAVAFLAIMLAALHLMFALANFYAVRVWKVFLLQFVALPVGVFFLAVGLGVLIAVSGGA